MDLNPDEAIAAGWLRSDSLTARLLSRMMNYSLRRADHTVVLDRFMKERLRARGLNPARVTIVPPWSHSDVVNYSRTGRERFRAHHNLDQKFVVMYSGNHSPCHPLDTLMDAAFDLKDRQDIAFCFIGGGSERAKVKEFADRLKLTNITILPYQPLDKLSDSLSAADLQVVVMGNSFVGIVHPCKVYNIIAVGSPILYIGPEDSHVTDLRNDMPKGHLLVAPHGDKDKAIDHILASLECNRDASRSPVSREQFQQADETDSREHGGGYKSLHSKELLLPQLCEIIEADRHSILPSQPLTVESALSITNEPGS
jgi:glycosyltransferase involved in cell wall biosynthesis